MKGLTIELINDYFIEVDELNHTLKKRYMGKTKDGEEKPSEKIIGYYKNTQDFLERIVRLVPLDENDGAEFPCVSMPNRLKKLLKELKNGEKRIMGRLTNNTDYCDIRCDFGKDGDCAFDNKEICYEKIMHERLKAYEDIIDEPEKLKLIDELYLERCEEINRLNAKLAEYKELKEEGLLFEMPVGIGDLVYVISKCEAIPPQLDGTLYGENGELGTATGYYCPYENNCPHECEECDDVLECDKLKTIEAIFEDEVESIYIDETGLNISTANCRVGGQLGKFVFFTKEEAEQALERMKEVQA